MPAVKSILDELAALFKLIPYGVAGLAVHSLDFVEKLLHVGTMGIRLIRTEFHLLAIFFIDGILTQIALLFKTKWTYYGKRHLPHLQAHRHGRKAALEKDVHHSRVYDVVHVVPQSDFVTTKFLRLQEHLLAPVP